MRTSTTTHMLLVFVFISIIARVAHSMSFGDRNAIGRESQMADEVLSIEDLYPQQIQPWLSKRRVDSAEKYFDWAGKTNRPMEYLRGKRFWLFTKKDEQGDQPDTVQETNTVTNAAKQGIWRSGIVGRRRR